MACPEKPEFIEKVPCQPRPDVYELIYTYYRNGLDTTEAGKHTEPHILNKAMMLPKNELSHICTWS